MVMKMGEIDFSEHEINARNQHEHFFNLDTGEDDDLEEVHTENLRANWNRFEQEEIFDAFKQFKSSCRTNNQRSAQCDEVKSSITLPESFGWIEKNKTKLPSRLIAKDISKQTFQPFALQHIAAAESVEKLLKCDISHLMGMYNMMKIKKLNIRVGIEHERKMYNFASIIENHMYQRLC